MFKINTFLFYFLLFQFISDTVYSQRTVLTDEKLVIETVTKEIDDVFQSPDFTRKKSKNFHDVNGEMTVDIGVIQNGKVSTFFKVASDIKNIDFINFMSDYILKHKFRFKLPKKQHYKIRYTITF